MKTVLSAFLLVAALAVTACSTFAPNYSALPADATADQKNAAIAADTKALKDAAIAKLKDPSVQQGAHNALVFAGKIALSKLADPADQAALKDQLFSWGNAADTLATGGQVTPDNFASTLQTFNTSMDASKYSTLLDAFNLLWTTMFPLLNTANDSDLWRQWLVVFSGAARDIGAPTVTVNVTAPPPFRVATDIRPIFGWKNAYNTQLARR